MLPAPFNPTPAAQAQILDALTDPTLSLRAVAAEHNTDTVSLAAWLETDEALAKLDTITRATRARIELIAANQTLAAIAAAHRLLTTFNEEEAAPTNPQTRSKRESQTLDCRARLAAIRAANFLLRVASPPSRGRGPGGRFPTTPEPRVAPTPADNQGRTPGATGSGAPFPRPPRPTDAATSGSSHNNQGRTPLPATPRHSPSAPPRTTPSTEGAPHPSRGAAPVSSTGRQPGESATPNHRAAERPASTPPTPGRGQPEPRHRENDNSPKRLQAAAGALPSGP